VDFLYADHRNEILFVTEIKDFFKITRQGKFKDGLYSEELEDNFVSKVQDTLNGLKSILSSDKATANEKNFCGQTAYYQIHAVFHWEFEASKKQAVRLNAMSYMKQKLGQRMNQTNIKVHVQNIADNPSKCWRTVRAE